MLSILIPIYNWSVSTLVEDLYNQCEEAGIVYEILLLDDGSTLFFKKKNRQLKTLPTVVYEELAQNIGRASIRNQLGKKASYPYLLFLDADAQIISPDFIQQYLSHLHPQQVVYGGCVYSDTPPATSQKQLHYAYGKQRETIPISIRLSNPYHSFKTFNFLVPAIIFLAIQFEESIQQYGHEDTLFGQALEQSKIAILHIDNPLEHGGIENTQDFLNKQQQAISTLHQLYLNDQHPPTKLLATYKKLNYWKLDRLVYFFLKHGESFITKQLFKPKPNLLFLDLYKLLHWLRIISQF